MNIIFEDGYDKSQVEISETTEGYKVSISYYITDWGTGNRMGCVDRDSFSSTFCRSDYDSEYLLKNRIVDYITNNAWGKYDYGLTRSDVISKLRWWY